MMKGQIMSDGQTDKVSYREDIQKEREYATKHIKTHELFIKKSSFVF